MVEILPVLGILDFATEGVVLEFLRELGTLYFLAERSELEILPVLGILCLAEEGRVLDILPDQRIIFFAAEGVCQKFWLFLEGFTSPARVLF